MCTLGRKSSTASFADQVCMVVHTHTHTPVENREQAFNTHLVSPAGEHVTSWFKNEVERMGFDTQNAWRISDINSKFR